MARSAFVQSLVDNGLVDEPEVVPLLAHAADGDFSVAGRVYDTLQLPGDRELLGKLYGNSIGKAHIPLDKTLFQPEALALIVPEMARKLECIPVYLLGDVLTVAMAHPEDAQAVVYLEKLVGRPVSAIFSFPQEIENGIEIQYGSKDELEHLSDRLSENIETRNEFTPEQLKAFASSAGVVDLVRGIMLYCLKHNASDIHVQPTAKSLDVRFRIDGQLQTLLTLSKTIAAPVIARLKVLASANIVEKRQPQDGRVSLEMRNRTYDFRLSIVPSIFGEKAVVRAIGSVEQKVTPLDQLGLSKRNRRLLDGLIRLPNGVVFVTGPTGSGKTTTLYSVLSELQRPEVNIVTVEDPVELRIDGITQIQTNAAIGLDFAKALRAVLRQDPNILLIGEIRDLETARIASQAALTGHLVMATMHTNSSLHAVTRLVDIGVDPFLLAPTVIGVLGQRLVRLICTHCKESYTPAEEVLDALFHNRGGARVQFYRGRGCAKCGQTGYLGRTAIHEVLVLTDEIREMIANRASVGEIRRKSVDNGFRPMRYDGLLKVLQGLTTLEEIDRVTEAPRQA